jgi:hypothetical protein
MRSECCLKVEIKLLKHTTFGKDSRHAFWKFLFAKNQNHLCEILTWATNSQTRRRIAYVHHVPLHPNRKRLNGFLGKNMLSATEAHF